MGGKTRLAAVLVALLGANPASAQAMKSFDINSAQSWNDALAICDVTSFLLTKPDLTVEVIVTPAPDATAGELRRPYFIPVSSFYSKVMKDTFEKVAKAGQATEAGYKNARYRYARAMLSAYPRASMADMAFLADQMRLCYALAANTRKQVHSSKKH